MAGNWPGALALFIYAAAFSFAYLQLDTGAGALLPVSYTHLDVYKRQAGHRPPVR